MGKAQKQTTIDESEVEKFSRIADEWWDETGNFKPLHQLNPTRLKYIREKAVGHFGLDQDALKPFQGLKVLDIGCGGGLLSIPVSRMGGDVTGVDASEKNIEIAKIAAEKQKADVNFVAGNVEELEGEFDIILNMEVVEHVADYKLFLESCAKLLKPNGMMFVATINRTAKAYAFAIVGAEYVLRLLPRGTHDWKKFLRPSEINEILSKELKLENVIGVNYNPITEKFKLVKDTSVNYMMHYIKE